MRVLIPIVLCCSGCFHDEYYVSHDKGGQYKCASLELAGDAKDLTFDYCMGI